MQAPWRSPQASQDSANFPRSPQSTTTGFGAQCSFARVEDRADGHLCKEVSSDEASCAASVGATEDANITKTWATIDQYVSAIVTASPDQGNATQCPSTAVDSGKYEANSSSYVAPRNGTGRR